jgi:SulP family sulfate permease
LSRSSAVLASSCGCLELLESDGVILRLARVKSGVLAVLRADGFVDRPGADRIHGNVHRAVEAQPHDDATQSGSLPEPV